MSTFSALNTASTALWAAQRGLDVTGQNIANVNTEGYSRQRVELQAMGGTAVPAIHSVDRQVGSGVDADRVIRIRDTFLERRAQTESARAAALTVDSEALSTVETALREPGETGIRSMLADVWDAFGALANDSTEAGARADVLEKLDVLADGLRTTRAMLDQQWTQTHGSLQALVTEVNATASSVAELNTAIRAASLAGLPTNELADRRDFLVQDLARKAGATSADGDDGMVDVAVGGTTLVSGGSALRLQLTGVHDLDEVVGTAAPRVVTAPGGTMVALGGTAGGQVGVLTTTLPRYRDALDTLARDLVSDLNAVQTTGYDAGGELGTNLMDDGAGNPAAVTASTITLRITDPAKLAADATVPAGTRVADGRNADRFSRLGLDPAGVDAGYRALVVSLGVESSVAARDLQVQTVISTQVDAARESVSGVNLDEEMTTMMSFQHTYSAAARMVTAIDEALDTLINRTGLVGR